MRKFCITVNGKPFDVEVEEVRGASKSVAASKPRPAAHTGAPAQKAAPAPISQAPVAAQTAAPQGDVQTSPLPGTVLQILKNVGDTVNAGEIVLYLEAMKMENEIVAPRAGVIKNIMVSKGSAVQTDTPLYTLG